MALRTPSRSATATSGPGRAPASDSRIRHRRSSARRSARHRHAPAEELRRRAGLLFAETARQPGESGHGPPPAQPRAGTASGVGTAWGPSPGPGTIPAEETRTAPAAKALHVSQGGAEGEPVVPDWLERAEDDSPVPDWRERAALAVRERMPMWLQTRCGLERRGVVALSVLLAVAAVFAAQHFWAARTQSVSAPQVVGAEAPYARDTEPGRGGGHRQNRPATPGTGAAAAPATGTQIVVDVSGKVRDPGIHRLPTGSRVADALRAAGGVRPGTSTEGLNQARFLVDGEQVVVGGPAPAPGAAGATPGPGAAGTQAGAGPAVPVSLNTATADQFDALPGVGPVLAQHIIDYRTRHGGFRSVEELRQVNGIGARRFADLRNLVRP
ncbi:helix-hairpin-helix domain-containing protein [Streptomyces sp. NPDC001843]|uniref:helix-hairpin-helix domain-containing protein n=1 Tax=Streptomyces sp. NPDC001843 TaxID=3364617 RepID=UPI00369A3B0D